MTALLGGDLCPLGASLQFLDAPESVVIGSLGRILGASTTTRTDSPFVEALADLPPFEAPWSRLLTAEAGRWTVIANNYVDGGDGTAPGPAIGLDLGVRCIVATHLPTYGPGHAQTQLEISGPDGAPPLMYVRTISSTATDGRWSWHESGDPLPFEETSRYGSRSKRERFDRDLLLKYLSHLGVPTDDSAYGIASHHVLAVHADTRKVSLDEARRLFGLAGHED